MTEVIFYRILPILVYTFFIGLALTSSLLIYTGATSQTERRQARVRLRQSVQRNQKVIQDMASQSVAEDLLKEAGNPLGINSFRYHLMFVLLMAFLIGNYIVIPILAGTSLSMWALVGIAAAFVLLLPNFPYSIFYYVIRRIVDYRTAKKSGEVFLMYDLLINELEMMSSSRINAYNILRNIQPYFEVISHPLGKLLSDWSSEGPNVALDNFAKDIGTNEVKSLAGVIKTLDDVEVDTALDSLKGMNNLFVNSQIENYRRRRKITTDLASIPIRATHFIIILNFLVLIVMMVSTLLKGTQL